MGRPRGRQLARRSSHGLGPRAHARAGRSLYKAETILLLVVAILALVLPLDRTRAETRRIARGDSAGRGASTGSHRA